MLELQIVPEKILRKSVTSFLFKFKVTHHNISENPFGYPKAISENCLGYQKELFRISNEV